jgi:hypothetical protein
LYILIRYRIVVRSYDILADEHLSLSPDEWMIPGLRYLWDRLKVIKW